MGITLKQLADEFIKNENDIAAMRNQLYKIEDRQKEIQVQTSKILGKSEYNRDCLYAIAKSDQVIP